LMQPILKQYKFELHGNKSYVFEQAEIKKDQSYINKTNQYMDAIFGILNDFDYDIENSFLRAKTLF